MEGHILCGVLLLCTFSVCRGAEESTIANKNDTDLEIELENGVVPIEITTLPPVLAPLSTTNRPILQGIRLPCSCKDGRCGCCTGMILDRFKQKACMNITYDPDEFAITAAMSMNERILYKNTFSGKNPPPMCIRVPRFRFIRFCVELSNIFLAKRNIHMCVGAQANWAGFTLVEWSFDCIRMGASGVAVLGPEDGGGIPTNPVDEEEQVDEDYDDSARNVPLNNTGPIRVSELRDLPITVKKLNDGDKSSVEINYYHHNYHVDDEIDEIDEIDDIDDDDEGDDEEAEDDDADNDVDTADYGGFSVFDEDFDIDNLFDEESGGGNKKKRVSTTVAPPPLRKVTQKLVLRKPTIKRKAVAVPTTSAKPQILVTKRITRITTPRSRAKRPTRRQPVRKRTRRPLLTTTTTTTTTTTQKAPEIQEAPVKLATAPTLAPTTKLPSTTTTTTTTTTTSTPILEIASEEISSSDDIEVAENIIPDVKFPVSSPHESIAAVTAMLQDIPGETIPQVEVKPVQLIAAPVRTTSPPIEITTFVPTEKLVDYTTEQSSEQFTIFIPDITEKEEVSTDESNFMETSTYNERFETIEHAEDEEEEEGPVQSFILKNDDDDSDEDPIADAVEDALSDDDDDEKEVTTTKIAEDKEPKRETKDVLSDILDGVEETFGGGDGSEENTKKPDKNHDDDDEEDDDADEDEDDDDEKENDIKNDDDDDDEEEDLLGDDDDEEDLLGDDDDEDEEAEEDEDDDEYGRKAKQYKLKGRVRQSRDMLLDRLHW